MNKITTTAGIVALGAASIQAAVYAPAPGSQEATKPWSISASLRGFYDDNYTTSPDHLKRDSLGFEVAPSASLNLVRDQTALGLSYGYSMRWYEDRDDAGMSSADHSHKVDGKLSHAFTPRFKLDLSDSFVYAQEPTLISIENGVTEAFLRGDGDVVRNHAKGSFSAGITENLTAVLGYANEYYDYEDEGFNSRSAVLDRMEHLASVNLRAVVLPKTVLVGGYQYEIVDYSSDDQIGDPFNPFNTFDADERNSTSHYFYGGVDQGITPTLNASLRAGAQLTKYDDMDRIKALNPELDEDRWSPYVDANATWLYMPGSYAQLGVRHQRAQSDIGFISTGAGFSPNLDAESSSIYGSVSHRVGAIVISALASYQHSNYDVERGDEFADDYFMAGVNVTYEINKFLALEAGYNFDKLDSELDESGTEFRSFDRNRVYVGVRGTY